MLGTGVPVHDLDSILHTLLTTTINNNDTNVPYPRLSDESINASKTTSSRGGGYARSRSGCHDRTDNNNSNREASEITDIDHIADINKINEYSELYLQ